MDVCRREATVRPSLAGRTEVERERMKDVMPEAARKTTRFRQMLAEPGILIAPVAYDCVSLRIMEKVGFRMALHGGYGCTASLLGMPDVGLITMTEMVGAAKRMAAAVDIPLLCDVDDGFGGVPQVMRTTREVIGSGLAGMYMEDQVAPKRCPALGRNRVISTEAMVAKLRAAARVREEEDPDFVLVARTHSSLAIGLKEAVARAVTYAQAGADVIFVDLGFDERAIDDMKTLAAEIGPHAHLIATMTESLGRPLLTADELGDMGYKIVIYPFTALTSAAAAVTSVLQELKDRGTTRGVVDRMMPVAELGALLGIDEIRQVEEEFPYEP